MEWRIDNADTSGKARSLRRQFDALARRAGKALDLPLGLDLLEGWLSAVMKIAPTRFAGMGYEVVNGVQLSNETGSIIGVCEESANFCNLLESAALERDREGRAEGVAPDAPPKQKLLKKVRRRKHLRVSRKRLIRAEAADKKRQRHAIAKRYLNRFIEKIDKLDVC